MKSNIHLKRIFEVNAKVLNIQNETANIQSATNKQTQEQMPRARLAL
jgi:hypothetical protein